MINEFRNFISRINNNPSIDLERKTSLIEYLQGNLFSNVRVFSYEDYQKIEFILEDLNYDKITFDMLLETTNKIRNEISSRNGKDRMIPNAEYLATIYNIFKTLNLDLWLYDNDYRGPNAAIARTAYRMMCNEGLLYDGTPILEVTKKIYNSYCSTYSVNKSVCTILKILNRVDKGLVDLGRNYSNVFNSEEFLSLFEHFREINDLHLADIVKDFYPTLGNELFSLIKKGIDNFSNETISTDYVMKYLTNIVERREMFARKKEKTIKEVEKIEVSTERNVELTFDKLIKRIDNNNNINVEVSKNIIENIRNVFDRNCELQKEFLSNEFDNFFSNCTAYINDLVIPNASSKNGIDELVGVLVKNCKDFFIEYDSKKFKEIVDYVLENTDISVEELKSVGEKCAEFFKEADINKLKVINNSLNDFKNYVNMTFNDSDFADNIFEHVLVHNPKLLLNDNRLPDLIKFLKGELTLEGYGYKYPNFCVKDGFLTHNFFNKIKDNDYKFLLEANLPRLIHNLNYLNEKCDICEISFTNFNINEDMFYTLLGEDLYSNGSNVLMDIKDLFNVQDFKKIMELNPELLMITSDDLELIVKRCLMNVNPDYNFYDLLSSELYFYKYSEYRNKNISELREKDFKYVNLDIDPSRKFDAEDIITDGYILNESLDDVLKEYNVRQEKINKLNELLDSLEKADGFDAFSLHGTVESIFKLYFEVYGQVPCVTYKNKVVDAITNKKERFEFEINDVNEELELKNDSISTYHKDKNDSDFAIEQLKELISSINSDTVKKDLKRFLSKFREERKVKAEAQYNETVNAIKDMELKLQVLERQANHLSYLLSVVDSEEMASNNIYNEFKKKKSFTVKDFDYVSDDKNERIDKILENKNVVLFADSVDLTSIPNDKNFVEKINKFLGDTDRSILSQSFMKNPSVGSLEKFIDQRDGIMSRREDRTPVRVYYIPVRNKYFNCYYVIAVNYKDHGHYDGGCSTDDVYNRRMKEVKLLEKKLEKMGYDEVVEFIEISKEKYDEVMLPIISKTKGTNKKKK